MTKGLEVTDRKKTEQETVLSFLGAKTDAEGIEAVRAFTSLPVAITLVGSPHGLQVMFSDEVTPKKAVVMLASALKRINEIIEKGRENDPEIPAGDEQK